MMSINSFRWAVIKGMQFLLAQNTRAGYLNTGLHVVRTTIVGKEDVKGAIIFSSKSFFAFRNIYLKQL